MQNEYNVMIHVTHFYPTLIPYMATAALDFLAADLPADKPATLIGHVQR
jgi:hypothetical protein